MFKVVLLGLLSLLDLALTLNLGFEVEANPIWTALGEGKFILGKILITLIACLTLYFTRTYRVSQVGGNLALGVYCLLTVYHLTILGILLY